MKNVYCEVKNWRLQQIVHRLARKKYSQEYPYNFPHLSAGNYLTYNNVFCIQEQGIIWTSKECIYHELKPISIEELIEYLTAPLDEITIEYMHGEKVTIRKDGWVCFGGTWACAATMQKIIAARKQLGLDS